MKDTYTDNNGTVTRVGERWKATRNGSDESVYKATKKEALRWLDSRNRE